jgi:L-alanine-DL-glutamate epimerase-like enolase superfamily enzyme
MRVTGFRTTTVSVPYSEPETWAFGKKLGVSNIIIELETDTGLIGLGEAVGFPTVRVIMAVLNSMRPAVVGRDPFDLEVIGHELIQSYGWHHFRRAGNCALGGVDMALWDLVGQSVGQPLYKLFGGAFRKRVPYYFYVPNKDLGLMAADAQRGVAEGFETIYVKLGNGFDRDLEIVRTVRDAIGKQKRLRVDANEAWSDGSAVELMKKMAQYDIEFFEQPLLSTDHDGAAHLRRALGLPIAANQSSWTEAEVIEVIKRGAADGILTDQHQLGSLSRFRHVAWLAATVGIPIMKHSFGDLGISSAAALHAMASCPNFTRGNQTHFGVLSDDIVEGGIPEFHMGCLSVPEGPGLGVKLDRQRLEKYAQLFREKGEFTSYGSGEDPLRAAAY